MPALLRPLASHSSTSKAHPLSHRAPAFLGTPGLDSEPEAPAWLPVSLPPPRHTASQITSGQGDYVLPGPATQIFWMTCPDHLSSTSRIGWCQGSSSTQVARYCPGARRFPTPRVHWKTDHVIAGAIHFTHAPAICVPTPASGHSETCPSTVPFVFAFSSPLPFDWLA